MEQTPKNKVIERLAKLKRENHALGGMELIIGVLKWYLKARTNTEEVSKHPELWADTERDYKDFSDEELDTLVSNLEAD